MATSFCRRLLLLAAVLAVITSGVGTAHAYDAGMTTAFDMPSSISGKTINAQSHGATPNDSSNDDAIPINKAIQAAEPGDAVYLPAGTYHVKSIISLRSRVSLGGQSRDTVILAGMYSSTPHSMIYAEPGVTNLTIANLTLTRQSGQDISAGLRLGNTTGGRVTRILARDLIIQNFQRFGIQLQNTYHVGIYRNEILNATALGGGGSGYGILIDQSQSSENWIKGNRIGPTIRHGILLQYRTHHNLIEENIITGVVSSGIDLHGEDEYSNEVRNNTITDCVRNGTPVSPNGGGIEIGEFSGVAGSTSQHDNSGPNNWVHHNQVRNCSYGLRIVNGSNHTYIEDNVFEQNEIAGIQADLAPLQGLHFLRNTVRHNGHGINLTDVTDATLRGNVVHNNINGMVLRNVTGSVVLENNLIVLNQAVGFWSNEPLSSYTVVNNTVSENGIDLRAPA